MLKIIGDILTDPNFIGAILISLVFISLGFILRHKNIINTDSKNFLTFLVLKFALPAMAFAAFMADFDTESFKENIMVFVISLALHIIFILIGQLILIKLPKDKRSIFSIFLVVGQLTFFAIPVLTTIYNDNYSEVMIPANMMTLAFRLILYIYCYFTISRLKFTKKEFKSSMKNIFLNPVMIGMFLGLFIWLTQGFMPKVMIDGEKFSFLRIDKTLPSIYMVITTASKLTTPLAMIIIGTILGEAHIKEALTDKVSWVIAIAKTLIFPLVALLIIMLLQAIHFIHFNNYDVTVIVIGFGAPLSAVVSTYCSTFDNEMERASRICFISTILCIVTYPLLFVFVHLVSQLSIFV